MNFNNYVGMGSANEVAQDYEQAVGVLPARACRSGPTRTGSTATSPRRSSGAGRMDEAKQAFAEMLRAYPDLTVAKFRQAMVFSKPALERMAQNLAQARPAGVSAHSCSRRPSRKMVAL